MSGQAHAASPQTHLVNAIKSEDAKEIAVIYDFIFDKWYEPTVYKFH